MFMKTGVLALVFSIAIVNAQSTSAMKSGVTKDKEVLKLKAELNAGEESFLKNPDFVQGPKKVSKLHSSVSAVTRQGRVTGGVFISEVGEGSSNNKFIEIYNGSGADMDDNSRNPKPKKEAQDQSSKWSTVKFH